MQVCSVIILHMLLKRGENDVSIMFVFCKASFEYGCITVVINIDYILNNTVTSAVANAWNMISLILLYL